VFQHTDSDGPPSIRGFQALRQGVCIKKLVGSAASSWRAGSVSSLLGRDVENRKVIRISAAAAGAEARQATPTAGSRQAARRLGSRQVSLTTDFSRRTHCDLPQHFWPLATDNWPLTCQHLSRVCRLSIDPITSFLSP
jgi:hypothetical protein